jgi:hypothetical protein
VELRDDFARFALPFSAAHASWQGQLPRETEKTQLTKIPDWIATHTDVKGLTLVRTRAEDRGETAVAEAITARITEIAIGRGEDPMTYAYDHLLEDNKRILREPLTRTFRMVPDRVAKKGMTRHEAVVDTLSNLMRKYRGDENTSFSKLAQLGRLDKSFEVFILEWANSFPADVVEIARSRLTAAGYSAKK